MASTARLAGLLAGALLSVGAIVVLRSVTVERYQVEPVGPPTPADSARAAALISESISFATVADNQHHAAFEAFEEWHTGRFPGFHETVVRQPDTRGHSMLFVWEGADPSLPPVLLLAHQDVVPVEPGTEADWTYPPYSGAIAPCGDEPGDCVWGRGAIDMKSVLVALSDAVEGLATEGWTPTRTLYFWFSDDEEVGGEASQQLDRQLTEQGVRFGYMLDEGLVVTDGLVPGVAAPVALVGIAEKGYLTVEVTASGGMGHSSMPPPTSSVGDLARAIAALEADPFPAAFDGPAEAMFEHLASEMGSVETVVFSNLWLTRSLVLSQLEASRSTNALVRTTQAPTQLFASDAENVLPQAARAVINYRLHPRDTVDGALARISGILDGVDGTFTVAPLEGSGNTNPSSVSPVDHPGYAAIQRSIRRQLPEAVVAPGLFIAATDSRHLRSRSDAIYRFNPVRMTNGDVGRMHGTDERVRVDDLGWSFAFYKDMVRAAGDWTEDR